MTHYDIAYIHTPPSFWLIFGILFLSVLFFFGCILYCAVTCLLRCCCHNTSVTVNKNKNIYGSIAEPRQLQEYELYQYSVEQHLIEPSAPMLPEASYWDGGNSDSNILTAVISPPLQHVDETPKFKDIWAALLFFANISFVCAFAIHVYFQSRANGSEKIFMSQFQFDSISNLDMIAYSLFVVGIPFFLGFSWLSFAIYHAETIIDSMMWFAILCNAVLALLCLLSGQIIGFIVMCIMCAGSIFYRYYVQNRIPFASSVLNVACASIQQHYSAIMIIVVLLCFLQLLWFILWAIASLAGITTIDDNSAVEQQSPAFTYPNKLVVFLLLLSLFWGLQLGYAILETTTSGVVACWWFQPNQKHPVRGSLFRAMTYSFGSLCFGSLIVSTIMASRDLLRMLRRRSGRQSGNIVLSIFFAAVDYILSLVESAAQYFNKYAYCYVAAYGHDFMTSGHLVMKLFHKRGWSAIVNDSLIVNVLQLTAFILALFSGVCGYIVGSIIKVADTEQSSIVSFLTILGFVSGAVVGLLLSSIMNSATAMIFVAFAENPEPLKHNHFKLFHELHSKWDQVHPESVQWVNYSSRSMI